VDSRFQNPGGAEKAFVTELTRHQGTLHSFLTSLLPGEDGIDDILQETNMVLWEKRDDFEPGTSFKRWAFAVARWQARAWLTARKRRNWLVFDDELVGVLAASFEAAPPNEGPESLKALRYCLTKLKESDRLLVLTHYQHGKSLAKCSSLFGRSVSSLGVSLFRLRAALRRCIQSELAINEAKS